MARIIKADGSVVGAISEKIYYVKARREVDQLAQEHSLVVVDMPLAIKAMTKHEEIRTAVDDIPGGLEVITSEYHGLRDGERTYEVWHSTGMLATANGIAAQFPYVTTKNHSFIKIDKKEWVDMADGIFRGQELPRLHLEDVLKGDVPEAGTPYTIFVRLDKDSPNINEPGPLNHSKFVEDDRVLMIAGSPENREELWNHIRWAKKFVGGPSIVSWHQIYDIGFDEKPIGKLTILYPEHAGIQGDHKTPGDWGCFMAVRNE